MSKTTDDPEKWKDHKWNQGDEMKDQKDTKEDLQKDLNQVNTRLEILDMIESRLFDMKQLAQRAMDEDLKEEEIEQINRQMNHLKSEVLLLDSEATLLS